MKKKSNARLDELQKNEMMAHLLDSLESGQAIGHYGRLVFAMVARHFMEEQELVHHLIQDPECSEGEAKALIQQVQGKDYSPPKRERILEWQQHQEFLICPNSDDPDRCNVYKDLTFPEEVYDHINSYYEQKAEVAD